MLGYPPTPPPPGRRWLTARPAYRLGLSLQPLKWLEKITMMMMFVSIVCPPS